MTNLTLERSSYFYFLFFLRSSNTTAPLNYQPETEGLRPSEPEITPFLFIRNEKRKAAEDPYALSE